MTPDAVVAESDPAPQAGLLDHVLCSECAYDLFGLSADGRCPECGAPIAQSLALRESDRATLLRMRSGVLALEVGHCTIIASTLLFPLFPLGVGMFILLQVAAATELAPRHIPSASRWRFAPVALVGTALMLYGASAICAVASPDLAFVVLAVSTAVHTVASAVVWEGFRAAAAAFLSRAAERSSRWVTMLYAPFGVALVALVAIVPPMAANGRTAHAADLVQAGAIALGVLCIVLHAIGLHALSTAARRLKPVPVERALT